MTTGWGRWAGRLLALNALALAAAAPPVSAVQADDDCRCVDVDGNQIEDCACFRVPRFEGMTGPFQGSRPRLGISVSSEQGSELDAQGARVTDVLEEGPAFDAGIRQGDVITRIDGQSLFEPLPGDAEDDFDLDESIPVQRLLSIAGELEPDQEVSVTFLRDGAERTATVTAEDLATPGFQFFSPEFDAERFRGQLRGLNRDVQSFRFRSGTPDDPSLVEPYLRLFGDARGALGRYGLELVELNPTLGQYFGTTEGVLVVDVAEDSMLGLEPGDVILRVGEREATDPERVVRILGSYSADEEIPIHVRRDGREVSVMGRLGG